jgi:hypothetical protein
LQTQAVEAIRFRFLISLLLVAVAAVVRLLLVMLAAVAARVVSKQVL